MWCTTRRHINVLYSCGVDGGNDIRGCRNQEWACARLDDPVGLDLIVRYVEKGIGIGRSRDRHRFGIGTLECIGYGVVQYWIPVDSTGEGTKSARKWARAAYCCSLAG